MDGVAVAITKRKAIAMRISERYNHKPELEAAPVAFGFSHFFAGFCTCLPVQIAKFFVGFSSQPGWV
ncbi:MAG: hypothetical protein II845_02650 [Oscillospiraceae bacterium]|nr:hypothetical protein [Oscillospiraceae bacterium]